MKLNKYAIGLSVVVLLVFLATVTVAGQIKIGHLKDTDVVVGCNCSIKSPAEAKKPRSQKYLFISETGTDDAWMNIDGRDTRLQLVKTTVNDDREYGVGSRYYDEYTAKEIKVRIDYVTIWVCPREDEECEHAKYDTTVTVTKGKATERLKGSGICSC